MGILSKIEQKILKRNLLLQKFLPKKMDPSHQLEIKKAYIALPEYQDMEIFEQEKFASCGPSILKTVFNYLISRSDIPNSDRVVDEKSFYSHSFFAKITVELFGIPPKILIQGIDKQLRKYQLPYFVVLRKLLSYTQIKQDLREGSLMIFSHMGDTHLHPHILRKKFSKKPLHDLHYFLLLAIDEQKDEVVVADPFGKQSTLSIQEFRERISLGKKYLKSRGGIYYAGVKTRVIPIRMAIILRKYPNI